MKVPEVVEFERTKTSVFIKRFWIKRRQLHCKVTGAIRKTLLQHKRMIYYLLDSGTGLVR